MSSSADAQQLTAAELKGMAPADVARAHEDGRCRAMLAGTADDEIARNRTHALKQEKRERMRALVDEFDDDELALLEGQLDQRLLSLGRSRR